MLVKNQDLQTELCALAEKIQSFGFNKSAVLNPKDLLNINEETRESILQQVELEIKILDSVKGVSITEPEFEYRQLDSFLEHFNFRFYDDVNQFITCGDVVEVYDLNFKQIYRNLTFLDFCSYDLLTLHTVPLFELYSRAESVNKHLMEAIQIGLSAKKTQAMRLEPHLLRETYLNNRKVFRLTPGIVSPVLDPIGSVIGLLITNKPQCFKLHSIQ